MMKEEARIVTEAQSDFKIKVLDQSPGIYQTQMAQQRNQFTPIGFSDQASGIASKQDIFD
jgi:hypothetical protein